MRLLAVVALVALVVPACSSGGKAQALGPDDVLAANLTFRPGTLTVPVGTTVTWHIDQPDAHHNVVSTNAPVSFNSGAPVGKGTFSFTFTQPGTYNYVCLVHPTMTGKVVVTAAATTTTTGP
jgi:plastocyanin